jgi:hypothetical protein
MLVGKTLEEHIMKRFILFIFAVLLLAVALLSCRAESQSAEELLSSLMADTQGLPAGNIYVKGAEEGESAYFSQSLCESMYGARAFELLTFTEDFAIYMASVAAPYEIAVFKCYSATDAEKLAAVCMSRAQDLRVILSKTEWRELCDSAKIKVDGRIVVMTVTGN